MLQDFAAPPHAVRGRDRRRLPRRTVIAALLAAMLLLPPAGIVPRAQEAPRIGESGLPLPRFASLASDEVNMRTGPGSQYPIRWVYRRRGLPVRIVAESDQWRQVEDPDGERGWIHSSLLSRRHTVLIVGEGVVEMKRSPGAEARTLLRIEPGVIVELVSCEQDWCLIDLEGDRGWVRRQAIWGAGS